MPADKSAANKTTNCKSSIEVGRKEKKSSIKALVSSPHFLHILLFICLTSNLDNSIFFYCKIMAEKIDAFVLRGANDASIEQVPMPPAPGPHGKKTL